MLEDLGKLNLRGIHWVIVGGESGPGARVMKEEWVLSSRVRLPIPTKSHCEELLSRFETKLVAST